MTTTFYFVIILLLEKNWLGVVGRFEVMVSWGWGTTVREEVVCTLFRYHVLLRGVWWGMLGGMKTEKRGQLEDLTESWIGGWFWLLLFHTCDTRTGGFGLNKNEYLFVCFGSALAVSLPMYSHFHFFPFVFFFCFVLTLYVLRGRVFLSFLLFF